VIRPIDILKGARALLDDPAAWIKGDFAQRKDGSPTMPNDADADCFCLLGALRRFVDGTRMGVADNLKGCLPHFGGLIPMPGNVPEMQFNDITRFNDRPETRHEHILLVLDIAIRRAESEVAGGA
jgi:hypothetical protein